MFAVCVLILTLVIVEGGHVCGSPDIGPVLGGVDFVQLKIDNAHSTSLKLARRGSSQFTKYIGEYFFWFLSEENAEEFTAKATEYVPQFGGYCAWGLTGYDPHVTDPSGISLGGACINSTNGLDLLMSEEQIENFWYLNEEAKTGMHTGGEGLTGNIACARTNYDSILRENNATYCFNTDNIKHCD